MLTKSLTLNFSSIDSKFVGIKRELIKMGFQAHDAYTIKLKSSLAYLEMIQPFIPSSQRMTLGELLQLARKMLGIKLKMVVSSAIIARISGIAVHKIRCAEKDKYTTIDARMLYKLQEALGAPLFFIIDNFGEVK